MLRGHEIYQNFRSSARNIYQAGFRAGVTEIQLAVAVSSKFESTTETPQPKTDNRDFSILFLFRYRFIRITRSHKPNFLR
jgi:hypothetical protein